LSGVLILTQPITLAPVVFALGFVVIREHLWRQATIAALVIAAIMSPWVIRNYVVLDRVILTKSPLWWNFYGGFMPESFLGGERKPERIIGGARVIRSDNSFMRRYYVIPLKTQKKIAALQQERTDIEMEPIYRDSVLRAIREHPKLYAEKTLVQAGLYWWVPPKDLGDNSMAFVIARKAPVFLLNLASIVGFFVLYKRKKAFAVAILATLTFFTIAYAMTQVHYIRYKLDIEWLQLYYAAAALEALALLIVAKRRAPRST
jgi:hypothetical protein